MFWLFNINFLLTFKNKSIFPKVKKHPPLSQCHHKTTSLSSSSHSTLAVSLTHHRKHMEYLKSHKRACVHATFNATNVAPNQQSSRNAKCSEWQMFLRNCEHENNKRTETLAHFGSAKKEKVNFQTQSKEIKLKHKNVLTSNKFYGVFHSFRQHTRLNNTLVKNFEHFKSFAWFFQVFFFFDFLTFVSAFRFSRNDKLSLKIIWALWFRNL